MHKKKVFVKFLTIIIIGILVFNYNNKVLALKSTDSAGTTLQNNINILDSEIKRYTVKTTKTKKGESKSSAIQCKSGNGTSLKDLIHKYWTWIIILAPIALIVLIATDLLKAIVASDADQLSKSGKAALKRTIAVVILLFLPSILQLFLGWFGLELCF